MKKSTEVTNLFLSSIKEITSLFSLFLKFLHMFTHLGYCTVHDLPYIVTENIQRKAHL